MRSAAAVCVCLILLLSTVLWAQPAPPPSPTPDLVAIAREFVALLAREEFAAAVQRFDDTMRRELPEARLRHVWRQVTDLAGQFRECPEARTSVVQGFDVVVLTCRFERETLEVQIAFNAQRQIAGLFFRPAPAAAPVTLDSLDDAAAHLRALSGQVSALVTSDGRDALAVDADRVMAVGSTFKLSVLAALRAEVTAGRRRWDERVELRGEWKSLPSGILQDAPDGSTHALQHLADLMISISDNTATDLLIHTLGRELVERYAPARNRPFLTTREAFVLKDPRNHDLLERYRRADEPERRRILGETYRRPLPSIDIFAGGPVALDVEWFYTVRELCAVIEQVQDLPSMALNPGVARRADWARVAFKGGSEPGVLNLTTWLRARNDRRHCVSATWNDSTTRSNADLVRVYGGLINLLARTGR